MDELNDEQQEQPTKPLPPWTQAEATRPMPLPPEHVSTPFDGGAGQGHWTSVTDEGTSPAGVPTGRESAFVAPDASAPAAEVPGGYDPEVHAPFGYGPGAYPPGGYPPGGYPPGGYPHLATAQPATDRPPTAQPDRVATDHRRDMRRRPVPTVLTRPALTRRATARLPTSRPSRGVPSAGGRLSPWSQPPSSCSAPPAVPRLPTYLERLKAPPPAWPPHRLGTRSRPPRSPPQSTRPWSISTPTSARGRA